jgi:hypothetical protein
VRNWKGQATFELSFDIQLRGDFHVICYDEDRMSKDDKMFGFWLNTSFIRKPTITLLKQELDSAVKDKKHKSFNKEFEVNLLFDNVHCELDDVADDIHGVHFNRGETLSHLNDSDDDDEEDEDDEEKSAAVAPADSNSSKATSSASINVQASKPVAGGLAARMAQLHMAASGQK